MKISIQTLGCKLNQAESYELQKTLEKSGYFIVPRTEKSDIAIIRACGVTCGASQTVRELIRQAKKQGALVIATGCLENKDMQEIDLVAKNNEEIIKYIAKISPPIGKEKIKKNTTDKTRLMIKIQNGCNFRCAYCIINKFRGRSQSISPKKIIEKIHEAETLGYQEIILTGVNICQYDYKKMNLADLLKEVLEQTSIPRFRLGSLDPRLIDSKLINIFSKEPRLLPHWHLSLQSGSDKILKKMNRHYTAKKYLEIIKKLRNKNPLFTLTTDIIIGFPSETEKDFTASLDVTEKARFAKVHVFPFSPRPNTPAFDMSDKVQDKIKSERAKILRNKSEQIAQEWQRQFIGHSRPVLFENKKEGFWYGYSPEYIRIKYQSDKNLKNKIRDIKIKKDNLI